MHGIQNAHATEAKDHIAISVLYPNQGKNMSQFLKVKTADEVISIVRKLEPLERETVELKAACGRVLSSAVQAPEALPHFSRATMDGYAVRAKDTFGASESLPALLKVGGEVLMGRSASVQLEAGKAIAIPTGGMLPMGADAVVMVEYTNNLDEATIEVIRPIAPGDNVLKVGEDIAQGETLFAAGWRLRPQDVGLLAALGIAEVQVFARPRVAIISTGDEVLPVSSCPPPMGKIRDINSFTLAAQVQQAGALVGFEEVVTDDLDALSASCSSALIENDVVLLSGGSSVGSRDFTLQILDRFPTAELLVHGIAIRPGKPTILARIGKKVFWGLPGQPVSALMIFRAFVLPSLAILEGQSDLSGMSGNVVRATLNRQLPSVHGRSEYVPVVVSRVEERVVATPIFGKSAMIGILAKADGYVIVPEHVEGLDSGSEVQVYILSR